MGAGEVFGSGNYGDVWRYVAAVHKDMGGVGMAVLILLCDGLAMPDRLAAAWVATRSLGVLGGLLALRVLRW